MEAEIPLILIAEDDPDDRLIITEALEETNLKIKIKFVHDGQELIDYLEECLIKGNSHMLPNVIILDLNMPKIDGRQALKFVKSRTEFKKIPTLILTTSGASEDVQKSYSLGVNSFIIKPANFSGMVKITHQIGQYWLHTVQLPD